MENTSQNKQEHQISNISTTFEDPKVTIDKLLSQIMKLKSENADLKSRINLKESLDKYDKSLTELIHEMREQNNKIISEKEEEGRNLRIKMDEIELEKKMEDLKNKRNNVLYNQKMSVIHDIELENKIFREEVQDLKKQNEDIKLKTKTKIESYDILNQLKFSQFKKKMIDNLKEAKDNVSKLNLEYMDLNGKITILQNYQLISEVEFQREQNEILQKEYNILREKVIELEKELAIQKKVSIKLALKSKENKEKIKKEKTNNEININLSNNDLNPINNNMMKTFQNKNIFSNNIIKEYSNKNNSNTKTNPMSRNVDIPFQLSLDGYYTSKNNKIDFKYIKYNKIIKRKNEEIEKLKMMIDSLKLKLEYFSGTSTSLFLFLEQCLNNFFAECKENYLYKNININISDIKKFNFDNLKKEEQYGMIILLMKYLAPYVIANYEKINIKEKFFKTNININLVKKDLMYNSPEKYVKEIFLKKSYGGKNVLTNLFMDTKNYKSNNIHMNKNRKESPNDSRIKNNKYKSLIK